MAHDAKAVTLSLWANGGRVGLPRKGDSWEGSIPGLLAVLQLQWRHRVNAGPAGTRGPRCGYAVMPWLSSPRL